MAIHNFKSRILILPGLGNSGPAHWQTLWEKEFGFVRVEQRDWETPVCRDWIETLDCKIEAYEKEEIILVAHSLACCTVGYWAKRFNRKIRCALLVAPSDTEADSYPPGTTGFNPMPVDKLPFPSTLITSTNDHYITLARAEHFAGAWGSEMVNVGEAGHINVASGYGPWEQGLAYLKRMDDRDR